MALKSCTWLPQQSYVDSCSEEASSEVISAAVSIFQAMPLPSIFAGVLIEAWGIGVCCFFAAFPHKSQVWAPSFVPGVLGEWKQSLLIKMHHNCPYSSQKFKKAKHSWCRPAGREVCIAALDSYLRLYAAMLTGAEHLGGVEIATNTKLWLCTLVGMTNQGAEQQLAECGFKLLIELWFS